MGSSNVLFCFLISIYVVSGPVNALSCYECDSFGSDVGCARISGTTYLTSCDHVYDAQYCVLMLGVVEGQLGVKRFCSSQNFGDTCENIRRVGDDKLYHSCTYTCSGDACNSARVDRGATWTVIAALLVVIGAARFAV